MSNVKLAGNVSGTGSVTIASPNTNSDISISLPTVTGGSFIVSDSSGNVGIGTSSPSTKFTVSGNANLTGNFYTPDYGYIGNSAGTFSGINTGFQTLSGGSGYLLAFTNGNERMRIDSSGNVGIGTSSPTAKLEVYDASSAVARVTAGTEIFEIRNTGSEVRLAVVSADPMTFRTSNVEAMRIDSSGNVGIGNTAANVNDQVGAVRPLLVSKSDTSTTIAGSQANIVIGNAATTTSNTSQISFAALTGANTTYFASAAINCVFGARTNGQYPTGQLVFSTSTSLNSAPTEKMRINAGGQLFTTIDGTSSVMADYGCRAWVNFNGQGTVAIRASGNVSSITDNGTGDYTLNFTTAMPDTNYSAVGSSSPLYGGANTIGVQLFTDASVNESAPTTTSMRIKTANTGGSALDLKYVCVSVFR